MKKILLIIMLILQISLIASCNWAAWDNPDDIEDGTGTTNSGFVFSGRSPSGLFATKSRYADAVNLTWDSVNGASYYEIYRAEMDSPDESVVDADYSRMSIAPIDPSYTDYDVESGKYYSYKVRARSTAMPDVVGEFSSAVRGWVLMAPSNLVASQGTSKDYIQITWNTVESVRGYRLEWSETGYDGDWTVAMPGSVSATDYTFTPQTTEFRFIPSVAQQGKSIFFRIKSISSGGVESNESSTAIGYTLVEGAPVAPPDFKASQGTSTTTITLTWGAMTDDSEFHWEIYRSSADEPERLICSTYQNDDPPSKEGDIWTYQDSNGLKPGIVYTYSVRALAEINGVWVNGSPSVTNPGGCLLSPPPVSNLQIVAENGKTGFQFVVEEAVGAQAGWKYVVYGAPASSGPWDKLVEIDALSDVEARTVFSNYNKDAGSGSVVSKSIEISENNYQYFSTQTVTDSGESQRLEETEVNDGERKPVEFTPPGAATGYSVTDNIIITGTSASNGVYPIGVIADLDTLVDYYNVRIWYSQPSNINQSPDETKTAAPELYGSSGTVIVLKDIATPKVGTRYWVAIQGVDVLGREGEWSMADSGYGAITDAKLILIMQAYCTKPWEYIDTPILTQSPGSSGLNSTWKNSQIYKMVSAAGLDSLGSATQRSYTGDGGLISYNAKVSGLGGAITFNYTNFGETDFLKVSNGFSMDVNASGTGSASGSFTLTGWYPASVGLANISVQSQKFVGTYTVTQAGRSSSEVSPDQGTSL